MARSFRISHPSPPAPTTSTLAESRDEGTESSAVQVALEASSGTNSPQASGPVSFPKGEGLLKRVMSEPRDDDTA